MPYSLIKAYAIQAHKIKELEDELEKIFVIILDGQYFKNKDKI